jgi:AMMECR1 domain-containing protein
MNKFLPILVFLFIFSVSSTRGTAAEIHPFDEISHHPQYQKQLKEIILQAVAHNFGAGNTLTQALPSPFEKPLGLFVTAKKDGEVLGCMGTIQPRQARLADEIFFNLQKAFSQDPRHRPISQYQVEDMEIFLTAVDHPERVEDRDILNPARDSILLRHGSKEAVVLAGEAKTLRYMLALAKSKAGIKTGESFQIYRLSTRILSVKLSLRAKRSNLSRPS